MTLTGARCDGSNLLPRVMGARLPDGTITGLCVSCQEFRPMYEVVPPSKPAWRREFRLAEHEVSAPTPTTRTIGRSGGPDAEQAAS